MSVQTIYKGYVILYSVEYFKFSVNLTIQYLNIVFHYLEKLIEYCNFFNRSINYYISWILFYTYFIIRCYLYIRAEF